MAAPFGSAALRGRKTPANVAVAAVVEAIPEQTLAGNMAGERRGNGEGKKQRDNEAH
jgi:hypothetical protein